MLSMCFVNILCTFHTYSYLAMLQNEEWLVPVDFPTIMPDITFDMTDLAVRINTS